MDSRTGKLLRLGRLLDPATQRGIIVAYSHGVLLGPQPGLRTLDEMKEVLSQCARANGFMIAPGLVSRMEQGFIGRDKPSLVVHLDWTNFSRKTLPTEQGAQSALATIADVAAAGADAVMTYLLLGFGDPEREAREIERNAALARECDRLGLVLMVEPRYAQEREHPGLKTDPAVMQLYCRVAAEIGADLVKCVWPGSVKAMADITESCPAPVLVAGGARDDTHPDACFTLAQAAVDSGCAGLVFGRSIYQSEDPADTLSRLTEIVQT